eukprot:31082-Pelagococcus_subviridis.AAC.2
MTWQHDRRSAARRLVSSSRKDARLLVGSNRSSQCARLIGPSVNDRGPLPTRTPRVYLHPHAFQLERASRRVSTPTARAHPSSRRPILHAARRDRPSPVA